MSRIRDPQKQAHRVPEKMKDGDKRLKAISHLHGGGQQSDRRRI